MKTLTFKYRFLFALLTIIVGFSNCKKETNTPSPTGVVNSSMTNVIESPTYVKSSVKNIKDSFRRSTYDFVIQFYSDPECTIPKSVSNLTVYYKETREDYSTQPHPRTERIEQVICNGTEKVLSDVLFIRRNLFGEEHEHYYHQLFPSPDYIIVINKY